MMIRLCAALMTYFQQRVYSYRQKSSSYDLQYIENIATVNQSKLQRRMDLVTQIKYDQLAIDCCRYRTIDQFRSEDSIDEIEDPLGL